MQAVTRVIKNTPVLGLQKYFDTHFKEDETIVNWQGNESIVTRRLLKAFSRIDPKRLFSVAADFDRVFEMTDEPGQQAIAGMIRDKGVVLSLENAYDRAMWLFLNDSDGFRRAEEIRFAEHYRKGQRWDGFIGPKGLNVSDNTEHQQEFEKRLCDMFRSANAQLELYDRIRIGTDEQSSDVTQAVVYRQGLPNSALEFNNSGTVERKPSHPVLEAVITYDSKTGTIEIVGMDAKSRPRLVRLFAEVLLQKSILGLRLPQRQYDLSSFIEPRRFPTDHSDGIALVHVVQVTVQLAKYPGFWMTLGRKRDIEETLYEYSEDPLKKQNPLLQHGVEVVQVEIAVQFRPDQGSRNGKVIKLKITHPSSCDLKGRTEKERLICEKYLPLWGLVHNA
jgi:hypothetical protein